MRTEINLRTSIITMFLIMIFSSCKNKNTAINDNLVLPKNSVALNSDQIKKADIRFGKIELRYIAESVKCSGTIEPTPDAVATVSAPIGGFIKKVFYLPGNYVRKGTVLAVLEHQDYIKLQQKFLETQNQLDYLIEEFKRQGELTVEDASSIKKMQQAQADFRTKEVKLISLKTQLLLIGINSDSLYLDKLQSTIDIIAPMSGYISRVDASIGKFAGSNDMIYEIIDNNNLQLHLEISETDICQLKLGQDISFWPSNDKQKKFGAVAGSIGQSLNNETNTFSVYANIMSGNGLRPGMHISADIYLFKDSVFAIASDAVLTIDSNHYIFLNADSVFTRIETEPGIGNSDYVELKNMPDSLKGKNIAVSGVKFLNAEFEKKY